MYGNQKQIHKGNIPHYLISSGVNTDEVLVLTQDIDKMSIV